MTGDAGVTRIAPGTFRVRVAGRDQTVYVAGSPNDRWAFWNGQLFRADELRDEQAVARPLSHLHAVPLSAPMPATVIRVFVAPGSKVTKGDTVLVLEAMKMELPIRSMSDGTIKAVLCREGELVGAGQTLVELE